MSVTQEDLLDQFDERAMWRRLSIFDWLWALLTLAGTTYAYVHYSGLMDGYEVAILVGTALTLIGLGWAWKPLRLLSLVVAGLSLAAIGLYGTSLSTWRMLLRRTFKRRPMTIAQLRASGRQNTRFSNRIPRDVTVEEVWIDDLHAEWISPSGGDPDKVVLHLHGGGYVTGGIDSHQVMCILMAQTLKMKILLISSCTGASLPGGVGGCAEGVSLAPGARL